MNYTLPNPNGLDAYIERAQTRLYNYLLVRWGITDGTKYKSFGRVYRVNTTDGGFVPQGFIAGEKDYVSSNGRGGNGALFFEDKLAALSYFYAVDPINKTDNRDDMAKVELYFFLDLSKITAGGITDAAGQRLDEVAMNDVENFVQNNGCGFTPMGKVRDVDKVLEKFSGTFKKESLDDNMQPRLCFKILLQTPYNPVLFQTPQQPQLQPMQMSLEITISASPNRTTAKTYVGNGKYVWNEYAEGNTLMPIYTDGSPFLAGKNIQLPFVKNDENISLPDFNLSTGIWTLTGDPYGFNATDFIIINLTNYS